MSYASDFDYDKAFFINSGLLSSQEQERIRQAKVTVLGMFTGGVIAVSLARAGFSHFTLIDHQHYRIEDMNRDIGCFMDTLGRNKAEVIRGEVLRINPCAEVGVVTKLLPFAELEELIKQSDVYFALSDDLAYSSYSLIMAQRLHHFAISCMPSGMTGYVLVIHPDLSYLVDPTDIFGSPQGLSYRELYYFLRNPLNRCGRRWHITEGKWRIEWFKKWRDLQVVETQLCSNLWLAASLASLEAVKYVTGKWQPVRAPRMWHLRTADNKIKVERFRRRTWLFNKFIQWTFSIKVFQFGRRYRRYTAKRLMRELDDMQRQEDEGKEVRPPFMWRHLI